MVLNQDVDIFHSFDVFQILLFFQGQRMRGKKWELRTIEKDIHNWKYRELLYDEKKKSQNPE